MDSDNSNRSSDVLRNVVMGRVMEDGSWTEVGRFSDANITFYGEEMPEEFTTKHLKPWDEVSFTVDVEPTFAKQIADEIYEAHIMSLTIIDEWPTGEPPVRDISWIRKQMKHCKNPIERKALEKELNAAFKEKKRRRKDE